MLKFLKCLLAAALVALVSACATAPGAKFTELAPPSATLADVYLYRTSGMYAGGQAFEVSVNDKPSGQFFNASYLHFQLPAGAHSIKVAPGGLGKTSELKVQVEAGKQTFMQYDFVGGLLANAFFLGSSIKPIEAPVAVIALKELKAAK